MRTLVDLCLLWVLLCLQLSPSRCVAADGAVAPVELLIEQLADADFRVRTTAKQTLLALRGPELQTLTGHVSGDSAEVNASIVRTLEAIMQAESGPDGEVAEKGLETLTLVAGSMGQAALDALIRNTQLREARATAALLKLGVGFSYRHPSEVANLNLLPLDSPEIGVGFGPPVIMSTIWIHSDWTGTVDDLWHIRRFSQRRNLLIYLISGCGVEPNDVWTAAAAWIPGLDVEQRGAASFGIQRGFDEYPGCMVGDVLDNGPAQKGGLRAGDRIVKVEEERVLSFLDLVAYLQSKAPLDVVNVTFVRRRIDEEGYHDVLLQTQVTLGSWRIQGDPTSLLPPPPFQGPLGPSFFTLNDRPPSVPKSQRIAIPYILR